MGVTNDNRSIAIYSRKSKFTGKGESIENQIELCKQYVKLHFPEVTENDVLVYEDEGFSGGTLERPQFKKLLADARGKKISAVICYRLDRVSRNISDFANLITELENLKVSFISIKEQFDTTSPMGRAMMYISSIFSQLERETIAERIRDNMHELAKSGRWLGGNTPTGYKSTELIERVTLDGKVRKAFKLEIIDEESALVKLIFNKFLETNALTKTETYLLQNRITTKNNKKFTRFSVKAILQNPVYMIADGDAWEYFEKSGVDLYASREDFDGVCGIMAYNKTIQKLNKSNEIRDIGEWIIAVGKHDGMISGAEWVKVQQMLDQNVAKSFRKPRSNTALLSGLLVCGNCGEYMRPKTYNRKLESGEKRFGYLCETKEKSQTQLCNIKNPNGNTLDRMVCEEIKKLSNDSSDFIQQLENVKKEIKGNSQEYDERLNALKRDFAENEDTIKDLVISLVKAEGTVTYEYISKQIDELHDKSVIIQKRIDELNSLTQEHELSDIEFDIIHDLLVSFGTSFDTMGIEEKRFALRTFIKKIVWDGETIHMYLFGTDDEDIEFPAPDDDNDGGGNSSPDNTENGGFSENTDPKEQL